MLLAVQERYAGRLQDPASRPAGALPVEVLVLSHLVGPPEES